MKIFLKKCSLGLKWIKKKLVGSGEKVSHYKKMKKSDLSRLQTKITLKDQMFKLVVFIA